MSDKEFPIDEVKNNMKKILLEPEIRFCGLVDYNGELISGEIKRGIILLENDQRRRKMFQELAHRVANRSEFDANLGRVKYSSSRREKVVIMSFPLGRYVILVIAEPHVNIDRLGWKIIDKLGKQWSDFQGF
jgi:hypothetical protein